MKEECVEIFGRHTSYNVQKVLWLADELGLDYRHTEVGGRFGGNDSAEFLAMNPMGKVPVLRQGGRVVWESNTILRYLADCYSEQWIATDPYERSRCDRWLDWSIARFEVAFVGVFWGYYRTPVANRDNAAIRKSRIDCETCLEQLGFSLAERPFLLGERPSLADVATGVFLHRLSAIDLPVAMPDNIERWYHRLSERPAYRRWVMSDFSELEGRVSY